MADNQDPAAVRRGYETLAYLQNAEAAGRTEVAMSGHPLRTGADGRQGFPNLTNAGMEHRIAQVQNNDQGIDNTERLNESLVRFENQPAGSRGYTVSEEQPERPGLLGRLSQWARGAASRNTSVESVSYQQNPGYLVNHANDAVVLSTSSQDGTSSKLVGLSDGRVIVQTSRNGRTSTVDITAKAAEANMTSLGIRQSVETMAADGEISGREQQTIKNLVNYAKAVSHQR